MDHFPVELCIIKDKKPNNFPFKFEQLWFKDDGFLKMIEKWWNKIELYGSKHCQVVNKLKISKKMLKVWNYEYFGNIFEKKE